MRLSAPYFRLDFNANHAIFALGPIGFISMNTRSDYGVGWGSFVTWIDLPGGSLELNLEDGPLEPKGPLSVPLFQFYPYE